ncbi:polycystic kidney disease and receptor for egg jelly-related protein [Fukomys damarensis]|uniref:polycystic kidney disease and receptor for egg jelly-related protein n=1 Tax=Fukomys damarensis TaxID=885580 RepID=UPI00053FB0B8|nr:polycystic kidney disease and receptor for egg jelly-related protein [Fukomys damarensis]
MGPGSTLLLPGLFLVLGCFSSPSRLRGSPAWTSGVPRVTPGLRLGISPVHPGQRLCVAPEGTVPRSEGSKAPSLHAAPPHQRTVSPCHHRQVKIIQRKAEVALKDSIQEQRWAALPGCACLAHAQQLQAGVHWSALHSPGASLNPGRKLLHFTEAITTWDPNALLVKDSDPVSVWPISSPLRAVLLGDASQMVHFTDELILNGTVSFNPDADNPVEGLHFSWYCTTNAGNYIGDQVTETDQEVCHPDQANLHWAWAFGQVLMLSPETLKGDRVYYFRMVICKGHKAAFFDKRVHVLQGPTPTAHISCNENCDPILDVSRRISLFLNCTSCGRRDVYTWSIFSPLGEEVSFDWSRQTVTGRNAAYLSVKAFAFQSFLEAKFWVSVYLESWSGTTLEFRHSFIINHSPQIGECQVNPAKGIAMFTQFVIKCSHFKDQHVPLAYKITVSDLGSVGDVSLVKENTLGTILYWGTQATAPPSFLPVGSSANHYALKILVQVYDSLGACSPVTFSVTVCPPTDRSSAKTVLWHLLNFTLGPTSLLSTLLHGQDWLLASRLMNVVASVLNSMETAQSLREHKAHLREHLLNQSCTLPLRTVEEVGQAVTAITELTREASEVTQVAQKYATVGIRQANQAPQTYEREDEHFSSEQIEMVSAGILMSLSNILKLATPHEVFEDAFYVMESLSDTVLAHKVPGSEATVLRAPGFGMYVEKVAKWDAAQAFRKEKHGQNWFHVILNTSRVPGLAVNAPVSVMFCEFTDDAFPWLNYPESISTEVGGFRMTGATGKGSMIEVIPDTVEVYLTRKNLTSATFNLTVGPDSEATGSSGTMAGAFSFEVDSRGVREVLVHIVTEVTGLLKVLVYVGRHVAPTHLVATFLVPHDMPPVVIQSVLFDPACRVRVARVVCLPPSLLQVMTRHSRSPKCDISVVLQAPHFVLEPSHKLVRISVFGASCLDMHRIRGQWREDACTLGEKTTWNKVHCTCRYMTRARRQLRTPTHVPLRTRYVMGKVITIPNSVDLQLNVTQDCQYNPVTLLTVLFIMVIYTILAFWALHRNEMDQFLWDYVVVLPNNDPYDNTCYLVTIFTGSCCGAGTRASVVVQLRGTESTSDVHCVSHLHFRTLFRGSISALLLTTKSDLGDIHSIRVWHNNEGKAPNWYLSRIKVENLFSRHIWLFMCRKWLSVDTTLERMFHVTYPEEPVRRMDFFLIDLTYKLRTHRMWFSVFADFVAKPFSRLQRLSCCLATLLSCLLCNTLFFNLNSQEKAASREGRYIRLMTIGIQSVLITIPVPMLITFFFTHSQKKSQVELDEVVPQKHPLTLAGSEGWEERLCKWEVCEADKGCSREASKPTVKVLSGQPKASLQVTAETAETNTNVSNRNTKDIPDVPSGEPSSQGDPKHCKTQPWITLPRWCVYVAWLLVLTTCTVSSVFIIFYGLTYSYDKSVEWLLASFCSFCQSVFLVQPLEIILWSGIRTNKPKYCRNLAWSTKYQSIEIKLWGMRMHPDERQQLQEHLTCLRGSKMYQPLMEDEIRIFRRRKRVKRRAVLFLSYIVMHCIFLALLLLLIVLLHHTDSFYYYQFIQDCFSGDLPAVTNLEDIYKWLNRVLLPLLHNDRNLTFLPDSSSKILGLPLKRQVRAKPGGKMCPPAKSFVQDSMAGEIHCHPKYGTDAEDTTNYSRFWGEVDKQAMSRNIDGFTYKPQGKRWVYYSYGPLHTYGSGGYVFYFFAEQQQLNSTLRLRELQESNWLDEKTWAVILELTTFNPDASLFCSISIVFEVSQLGVVNASISTHSFSLTELHSESLAEIYLYVAILIFFLAYIVDEGYVITQEGASYVKSMYNLLNFTLKCIFTALVMLFFRKYFLAAGMIQFYLSNPHDFIPFQAVSQVDQTMRIILAFLLFLTILKTPRYSRFFCDVRLAQRVIQAALPGICHMAIVVSVYFFVYMAFGYLVFGQHEWNYSNLIHATQTIFSYCVSAFQNTKFSSNKVLGVLFLSSFLLVMVFLLINLFQAMILSAYEDMKQPVYEEPSEEVEVMSYLYHKLRSVFSFLAPDPRARDEPEFFIDMLYGQPEKKSCRHLGLKTQNINGKKIIYLVV